MIMIKGGNSPAEELVARGKTATNIHGSCFYTEGATLHNTLSPFGCIEALENH